MPPPKFQLALLGRFELTGPEGPIDLTSKKLAGLLAFLACTAPQAAQPRQAHDPAVGLAFRGAGAAEPPPGPLPAAPCAGRGRPDQRWRRSSLRPASHRLRRDAVRGADLGGSRDALDRGGRPLQGPLLADIAIPEEAWTEWLDVQRQRLEGLALDAMVRLGEQELQLGNHEPALNAANRAIAISSLREDAHRLIMRALAAGGRRADALKHYEDLAALLKRELTVEPDPTTGRSPPSCANLTRRGRHRRLRPAAASGTGATSWLSPTGPRSPCCRSPT